MRAFQLYLIFHFAGGVPLCFRAFRGEPFGVRLLLRWVFGLVFWPIPTAGALYEVIRDAVNERK